MGTAGLNYPKTSGAWGFPVRSRSSYWNMTAYMSTTGDRHVISILGDGADTLGVLGKSHLLLRDMDRHQRFQPILINIMYTVVGGYLSDEFELRRSMLQL